MPQKTDFLRARQTEYSESRTIVRDSPEGAVDAAENPTRFGCRFVLSGGISKSVWPRGRFVGEALTRNRELLGPSEPDECSRQTKLRAGRSRWGGFCWWRGSVRSRSASTALRRRLLFAVRAWQHVRQHFDRPEDLIQTAANLRCRLCGCTTSDESCSNLTKSKLDSLAYNLTEANTGVR